MVAVVLGSLAGGSDPASTPSTDSKAAISAADPPRAAVDAAPCAKVLAQLPITLGTLKQRVVHTQNSPFVVAWGDPAVVFRCGQNRPKALAPGSGSEFILGGNASGPYYDVQRAGDGNSYTTVDRAAYVSITVPRAYQGGDILPTLSAAIAKVLPAVCSVEPTAPLDKLCTRRR